MKKDYFILAFGNLRHRGLRSWLTILGVFIGIAAVVALITMGNGLREAITGQFSTLSTDKLVIQNAGTGLGPPGSTAVKKLTDHDVDVINKVSGVDAVVPRFIRMVEIEFNKETNFNYVTNIPPDEKKDEIIYSSANLKVDSGRLLKADGSGKVILGANIAKEETFGKQITVGDKIKIQGKSFEVVGILKTSSSIQINQVIFMGEKDLTDLLNIKNQYDMIVVQVSDSKNTEAIAEKIKDELRKDRKEKIGEEDFSVQTPLEAISSVNTILDIVNLIVAGIAAISLIVGAVGIANTMYTSVLERTKEIGTMKAVGAQNKEILYIFVIESGLLGLIGGVIGAGMGIGLAFLISAVANSAFGISIFAVQFSSPLVFGSIGFALAIGIISGLMPAFQASKLKPVDAFRR